MERRWEKTVLTEMYTDAFLIEIALIKVISSCSIIEKDFKSPGSIGYSTPRLLNVSSYLMGMNCGIQLGPRTRINGGFVVR